MGGRVRGMEATLLFVLGHPPCQPSGGLWDPFDCSGGFRERGTVEGAAPTLAIVRAWRTWVWKGG